MRFDILGRDLNVFEPHFLEASAGTGKTFAIEHFVVRLLIEGNRPLPLEQILVVTFTRAATRELKSRIRLSAIRAKEELLKKDPTADYLKAICEKGDESIQAAIQKLDAALICYDAAQIYTLHGFCHRILKEFAFEAGVSLDISDPDEKEHVYLMEQVIKEHLKDKICAPQYSGAQLRAVLKKNWDKPCRMVSNLAALISNTNAIAVVPSHCELLETLRKEIESLVEIDKDSFKADVSLLIVQYRQMTGEEIPSQIDLLAAILSSKKCTEEQFDRLLVKDFFLEKMDEDNQKVRAKFPENAELHYPGLVESVRKALVPLLRIARDPAKTTLRLAKDLQEASRDLLEKREKFSPDDLLFKVEEALKKPDFATRVRQKFRAAIVDEFQDTDPTQWKIFEQLFLSHMDSICLVGDPKQSIYAFRNADVYVYLEAAQAMGPSAKKHLDTNFRSTQPLVSALNLLFSRAHPGWMSLPGRGEALEVLAVKAGARLMGDESQVPAEFFIASGKKGRSKKFPTTEMCEQKIFPYIASEIFKLHAKKNIEYHQIAILVKDRFQARAIVDYLQKCGIPASSKRGGSILDTDAFFALKEILAAVWAPHDISKVKAALGGPIIGWQEEQLCKGADDPSLLEAKAKMQSLRQTLFEKGFGPFFQGLLQTERPEDSLYQDLRKLCELLIEEETQSGLKGDAFLSFLEEIEVASHPDETRFKAPLAEEKGSVAILTMHMSKGLEFDAVFALGVASRSPASEQVIVKTEGRRVLTHADPSDPLALRFFEEVDAEKMRQFYVALTRAKRHLYIPLAIQEDRKELPIGEASPAELFFAKMRGVPIDHAELYRTAERLNLDVATEILEGLSSLISYRILPEALPPCFQNKESTEQKLSVTPALHLPVYDEQLFSFSSLAKKEHSFEAIKPSPGAILSPHTMPLGSQTGHILHLLFEKIFKRGLHHPLDESAIFALIQEEIAFSLLTHWQPILLLWIVELLTQDLGGFSLSHIPSEQLQQEMEFFFPMESGMMKGFADLFFEWGGKYYLLDWKSNYLGPSDADYAQDDMAEAMRQNQYDLQASIYAEALERYVKLFDNRPFSECFGGAIYYFIRGKGVYHFFPESYSRVIP